VTLPGAVKVLQVPDTTTVTPVGTPETIPTVIKVTVPGPQGPTGATGAQGPAGIDTNASYTHHQNIASDTWLVVHNLGFFPSVTVEDSAGNTVEGDIAYTDSTTLQLTFSAAFGGVAYLS
jgi:hypothetical protein